MAFVGLKIFKIPLDLSAHTLFASAFNAPAPLPLPRAIAGLQSLP